MISQHLLRLFVAVSFALSILPSVAQQGEEVNLQFLSFPRTISPKPLELVTGERQTIEVEIPSNELSKPYKVKRQSSWIFGESVVDENGEPSFEIFGQAPALASPNQLILLVRKGGEDSDGIEVIPIDNRMANFGGGKFLFINVAKVDIAGEIGSVKFAIRPGERAVVTPKADVDRRRGAKGKGLANAALFFRKDNEAKPFFRSIWPLNDKARSLIFFYHDPETTGLRMHSIRDFLP